MLQLMPYLSRLTPENLIPIYIDGLEDKYIIVNCHKVLTPYCPDLYSKCIIRIPEEINEEISIYQYPRNGTVSLDDLISLFTDGRIEDNQETPRSTNQAKVAKEREFIRECDFTAQG